tara:strand:+ start:1570 stop:2073 length:504 start_codon:yes stop_codon:yes gene_type:complete
MSWFNLLKTPTDSIEEWRKDRQNYMLKDKVWREAGGNRTKNAMREDPTSIESIEPSKEGFRFAKIEEIEEKLGRDMTVDDFQPAPINWRKQEGVVFDRIGKEGQIELAKQFLIRQKDAVFPFENDGILYENLQQWSRNKKVRAAIRLIGRPSIGLKLMGYKEQGRWE